MISVLLDTCTVGVVAILSSVAVVFVVDLVNTAVIVFSGCAVVSIADSASSVGDCTSVMGT